MIMGFFVLAAFVTGEWILVLIGLLPPFVFRLMVRTAPQDNWKEYTPLKTALAEPSHPTISEPEPPSVNFDEMIAKADSVIAADPKSAQAHLDRGIGYLGKKDDVEALRSLNMALYLDPQQDMAHVLRGNVLLRRDDIDGAIREYNQALRINPRQIQAAHLRALAQAKSGKRDRAMKDLQEAIKRHPNNYALLAAQGYLHFLNGDYHLAEADFAHAASGMHPYSTFALAGQLAAAHLRSENETAQAAWKRLMEHDPHFAAEKLNAELELSPHFTDAIDRALVLHNSES